MTIKASSGLARTAQTGRI